MKLSLPLLLVGSAATASSWLLRNGVARRSLKPGTVFSRRDAEYAVEARDGEAASEYDIWNPITPTHELVWKPCYGVYQCSKLQVPLDYSKPDGRQASIALIRMPAAVPRNSSQYKGPILFNPGGPGGSGVDLIRDLGTAFATILGPQFDLVGFDPRGIARSSPRANFFDTDVERQIFGANNGLQLPVLNDETLAEQLAGPRARARLIGILAAKSDDGYLGHLNTPNTATDMLRIVQAHGRDKLQYWGFSYGSVLGATFAAIYPDNIERLVIDGVMDSEDYYATGWLSNLVDTDKTLQSFFDNCAEAGPNLCGFYAPDPADIRRNLTALYHKLRAEPIPVQTDTAYGVVDESSLRAIVFLALYSPDAAWVPLANALKQLAAGDASGILTMTGAKPYVCSNPEEHKYDGVWDSQAAVLCNDGDKISSTIEDLEKYIIELSRISDWADIWGVLRLPCIQWPQSKKYFRGPFVANTSFPLLLVGNTADPVTPLRSAKKMSAGFKGSVVLTQDSPGHASINNPSVCTQLYIRSYFQDGTLPPPDTVCQPIKSNPFKPLPERPGKNARQVPRQVSEEDEDLWNAISEISGSFKPSFFPSLMKIL